MDGYHLSRAQLSSMPDPAHAHARRGAAFTFDPASLYSLILLLRQPLSPTTPTYYAPSFSHSLKDPIQNDIPIPSSSRILILEGNYLSLSTPPWDAIAKETDELWFVEVDFEVAGRRLVARHVKAGIAGSEEEAWHRVRQSDLVNGRDIVDGRLEVDEVIFSREDKGWKVK